MTEKRVKLLFLLECEAPEDEDINDICDFLVFSIENSEGRYFGDTLPYKVTSIKVSLDQ